MIKQNLSASPRRSRPSSITLSYCLLLVLLVFCGNTHPATTTFDPDAEFETSTGTASQPSDLERLPRQGYEMWATDMSGTPGAVDFQINNGPSRVTGPAAEHGTPSRLSFFYILGTAVIIALLVEIYTKKDI